jgi:spermidine synthase
MVIDHMVHSTNVIDDPAALWTPYIRTMDALIHTHFTDPANLNYFFAGGGAYTHPRSIAYRYPEAGITVSEIDPAVTALAEKSLYLDPRGMTIHHDDTRNVLRNSNGKKFDVMITDVFHDVGIPYHLTTLEHATLIANKLSDRGLYMLNVIDVFPSNRLMQSMVVTLKQVFPHVAVWIEGPPDQETRLTFVIAAAAVPISERQTVIEGRTGKNWYEISEFIDQQIAQYEPTLLTDDYAPVERLLRRLLTSMIGS